MGLLMCITHRLSQRLVYCLLVFPQICSPPSLLAVPMVLCSSASLLLPLSPSQIHLGEVGTDRGLPPAWAAGRLAHLFVSPHLIERGGVSLECACIERGWLSGASL